MDEIEVWRTASTLLSMYGREASSVAEGRAESLVQKGDKAASLNWIRIFRAVEDFSRRARRAGEPLN